MSDATEKPEENRDDRQWVAPQLTVLVAGATAGGPVLNTEAFNYHPS